MAQVIKIQLIQSLIINSVKNETFLSGLFTKADNDKLVATAYHEAAGDEQYHERMLARGMFSQAEKLKTWFADYLTGEGYAAEDALVSSTETDDTITILLSVSDRFVKGYVKTLARLSQKYVEDRMIHLWWAPLDEKKSAYYDKLADDDLAGILRCFSKKAPSAPTYQFAETITLRFPIIDDFVSVGTVVNGFSVDKSIPVSTLRSHPFIMGSGDESEITYILSNSAGTKPIDDIIVRADNACCSVAINDEGRWCIRGERVGLTIITLFSRHDDRVFNSFCVRVVPA